MHSIPHSFFYSVIPLEHHLCRSSVTHVLGGPGDDVETVVRGFDVNALKIKHVVRVFSPKSPTLVSDVTLTRPSPGLTSLMWTSSRHDRSLWEGSEVSWAVWSQMLFRALD